VNAALAKAFDASSLLWRPLRTEDVPAVAALEHESHLAPWTPDNFIDALAAGYSLTVGVTADMIVAYGVLLLAPGEAQLLNLTVAPRARRQGLGRTLLKRFSPPRACAEPSSAFSRCAYRTAQRSRCMQRSASWPLRDA